MASSGTGKTLLAYVIIKGVQIPCVAVEHFWFPESVAHRATDSLNVKSHSEGQKRGEVSLEKEIIAGQADFNPEDFDATNPTDVIVVEPNARFRYVQGVLSGEPKRAWSDKGWKVSWTMGEFKDRRTE